MRRKTEYEFIETRKHHVIVEQAGDSLIIAYPDDPGKGECLSGFAPAELKRMYGEARVNVKKDCLAAGWADSKKPDLCDRIELELHMSHDPPNEYIMQVWLEGECIIAIWCDHIGVYPTAKPPIFTLSMHGSEICGVSGRVLRIRHDAAEVIPKEMLTILGKYVELMPAPEVKKVKHAVAGTKNKVLSKAHR